MAGSVIYTSDQWRFIRLLLIMEGRDVVIEKNRKYFDLKLWLFSGLDFASIHSYPMTI